MRIYVSVYVCVNVRIRVCICVYVYKYACGCVVLCVCVCTCVCVFIVRCFFCFCRFILWECVTVGIRLFVFLFRNCGFERASFGVFCIYSRLSLLLWVLWRRWVTLVLSW